MPGEGGGALPGGKGGGWGDSIDVAAAVSNWQKTHITARSRATPCAGEGEERQEFGSLTASDGGGCQSTLAGDAVGTTPRGRMMGSGHVADGSGPASPVGKRSRDAALAGHVGFAACAAAPSQQVWDVTTQQWCTPLTGRGGVRVRRCDRRQNIKTGAMSSFFFPPCTLFSCCCCCLFAEQEEGE